MTRPTVLSIEPTGDQTARVRLAVPPNHEAFAGHFPNQKILPGIIQLDWAIQLAATCFGFEPRPAVQVRVKFMQIIGPDPTDLSLSLRYDPSKAELTFEYRNGDTVASRGSARLAP
jgi:3-hydroxymyristoyl/3-hydroxydecanoyl-(acyl carrier protein) dehydratase